MKYKSLNQQDQDMVVMETGALIFVFVLVCTFIGVIL